jgi:phosphoribosylaminoimidazole carboxylase (NCAIR synthetase)
VTKNNELDTKCPALETPGVARPFQIRSIIHSRTKFGKVRATPCRKNCHSNTILVENFVFSRQTDSCSKSFAKFCLT